VMEIVSCCLCRSVASELFRVMKQRGLLIKFLHVGCVKGGKIYWRCFGWEHEAARGQSPLLC